MADTPPARDLKRRFHNYPPPIAHEVAYETPPPNKNPKLRGLPLYYAGELVASVPAVARYLYNNAGFNKLRALPLEYRECRYDPTVVPIEEPGLPDPESYTNPDQDLRLMSIDAPGKYWSIKDYYEAYKSGKCTPEDVVEFLLPLICKKGILEGQEKDGEHSVAFLQVKVDEVRRVARESTQRWKEGRELGLLDGIPVGVKDEVNLKGYMLRYGSPYDFGNREDETSWSVRMWEREGVIVLGKTSMHEFGIDVTNNNHHHGTPLNPHNPHYYTGGSSGGSAYAISSGLIPLALGVDGGGSIRLPSSFCGISGLKPSHGRVSAVPTPRLCPSVTCIGPMATSVRDLGVGYRVMAQPGPSSSWPVPRPLARQRQKKIAIYEPWFNRADPVVKSICNTTLDTLKEKGYEILPFTLPHIHSAQFAHALTILSEQGSNYPRHASLSAGVKINLAVGACAATQDFMAAQRLRGVLMSHLAHVFQTHPDAVIVTPTAPNAGWRIDKGAADLNLGVSDANMTIRSMEYVFLANLTGVPALSVPVGFVDPVADRKTEAKGTGADGKIPVGLMGMAEWGAEEVLLGWGADVEEVLGTGRRRPAAWVDVLGGVGGK
ncbi:amidase signature enzyme [Patellaria atrata CBS 101060]|uniref:Amidase signature enzyme n=1 Tax=Patellaria atrata CBS 101060 TaxID=1346257 RepID=A0A9P4SB51_9PEZI|nr:amidase signature enzyme [Patellaria atrata CBS 101060]